MSDFKKCPCCDKRIYIPPHQQWIYKVNKKGKYKYFCGWNCMQKYRKENCIQIKKRRYARVM